MKRTNNIQQIVAIKDKKLFNMLKGAKGGKTRIRILDAILVEPSNANQLSKKLNLDYKTITYHLNIICNHNYATKEQFEKSTYYHPSDRLIKRLDEYTIIKEQLK